MSIPTRDELIERAGGPFCGFTESGTQNRELQELAADFALSEIRRALVAELEALRDRSWDEVFSWRDAVNARLAALRSEQSSASPRPEGEMRSEQNESMPPLPGGVDLGELVRAYDPDAARSAATGTTAGLSAEVPHGAGASERERLRDESPAGNVAAPALSDADAHDCGEFDRGWFARDARVRQAERVAEAMAARPPFSDADCLERAQEIIRRESSFVSLELEAVLRRLRAASAPLPVPKPVDVFEAIAHHHYTSSQELSDRARDWFGPLVEALEWIARGRGPAPAGLAADALLDLRRKAEEASRG